MPILHECAAKGYRNLPSSHRDLPAEIVASRRRYEADLPRLAFLAGLESMIRGIVNRSRQYAAECRRRAADPATPPARRAALLRMAANCERVPERPAQTFEEAVQRLYFCFPFQPDSIGHPDQYLLPLYERGLADGSLTRNHAKELRAPFATDDDKARWRAAIGH